MRIAIGLAILLPFAAHASDVTEPTSLIVVGDPQLHSLQGGSVFQASMPAARFEKVAQRFPEQNLLADYVFEELSRRASQLPGGSSNAPVVLLGDGMNEACSGEFDRVEAVLSRVRGQNRIALWAPGNHDVYLAGTVNSRFPGEAIADKLPINRQASSSVPLDVSWWPAASQVSEANAWMAICADEGRSAPINKAQWIRRYADQLGVNLSGTKAVTGEFYYLTGAVEPMSDLSRANFQLIGRWYPPLPVDDESPNEAWFAAWTRPYRSYVVQAVDLDDQHRLVLIDTSVCEQASLNLETNAGTNACIPDEELEDIDRLATTDRRLIFGGHFPLADIGQKDQKRLLRIFNKSGRNWTYISAHTHAPASVTDHGKFGPYGGAADSHRYDFNVGSTTDWPIEAHRFVVDDTERGGEMIATTLDEHWVKYEPPNLVAITELCRHLTAARRLAAIDMSTPLTTWDGGFSFEGQKEILRCERDREAGSRDLAEARKEIARRVASPEEGISYRERLFSIFRGASRAFDSKFSLEELLP
jgi:hypothetical protein